MDKTKINYIALQGVEPKKLDLLKQISKSINEKTVLRKSKKNCRHCYGRGFIGYLNGIKALRVQCRCVLPKVRKVVVQG